jgi:hypothetical protein
MRPLTPVVIVVIRIMIGRTTATFDVFSWKVPRLSASQNEHISRPERIENVGHYHWVLAVLAENLQAIRCTLNLNTRYSERTVLVDKQIRAMIYSGKSSEQLCTLHQGKLSRCHCCTLDAEIGGPSVAFIGHTVTIHIGCAMARRLAVGIRAILLGYEYPASRRSVKGPSGGLPLGPALAFTAA